MIAGVFASVLAGADVAGAAEPMGAPNGALVTVAGIGEDGYSGDGQRATDARIGERGGIAVGPDGTLYIVDGWGGRIRAVDDAGMIDTVPGTRALRSPETDGPEVDGWQYSPSDRPRAAAVGPDGALYIAGFEAIRRLGADLSSTRIAAVDGELIDDPRDIAVDGSGNVYVSGSGYAGDSSKILKIDPAGQVTTIGGGGTLDPLDADGKPATEARLGGYSVKIAVAAGGTVYLVAPRDPSATRDGSTLHRIDPQGTLHTVAGGGEPGFSGDGGPAAKARLSGTLGGVAVAVDGDVYLHDQGNGLVRVIGTNGVITSIAPPVPTGDGYGGPDSADLALGPRGDVYVKVDARVHMLVRNEKTPATQAARRPGYRSRFPHDKPGTVRTIAGSGRDEDPAAPPRIDTAEDQPLRIAVGPDGTRYYSDAARHRVMKVAADGTSSVLAGNGDNGFAGDGGPAAQAVLDSPMGVEAGQDGSVYIADSRNYRVRKVDPTGVITTVAGNGQRGETHGTWGEDVVVHGDGGPAIAATVAATDVALGTDGSLYIAEAENSRISRVAPDGTIGTVAGLGERWMEDADGRPAAEANFFQPYAVAVGPDGTVYLLDDGVETIRPAVRMIDTAGIVRTVAGDSYRDEREAGFGGDGGPAATAELNNPHDIATGPDGTLYIADTYNARVRAVDAAGTITTVAGTGARADSGDGTAATTAAVNEPQTIDVDAHGAAHIINLPGDRIREIGGGTISTVGTIANPDQATASSDVGKPATEVAVEPVGIAIGHDGVLLIAEQRGELSTVDSDGTLDRPVAAQRELALAQAVAVGPDGARYVAAGGIVYHVSGNAAPVPMAGGGPQTEDGKPRVEPGQQARIAHLGSIRDLAVSPAGRLHIATATGVYRLDDDGTLADVFSSKDGVSGIAVDAAERLYVAVSDANRVYRVDTTGERTTFAGNGSTGSTGDDDAGTATETALFGPADVAVDSGGTVYIGTYDGIHRVDTDGTIFKVAGNPFADGGRFAVGPLVLDRHGDLYFADRTHNHIKVLVRPGKIVEPFEWGPVMWNTAGALALAVLGWFGLRWWERRPGQPFLTGP